MRRRIVRFARSSAFPERIESDRTLDVDPQIATGHGMRTVRAVLRIIRHR